MYVWSGRHLPGAITWKGLQTLLIVAARDQRAADVMSSRGSAGADITRVTVIILTPGSWSSTNTTLRSTTVPRTWPRSGPRSRSGQRRGDPSGTGLLDVAGV